MITILVIVLIWISLILIWIGITLKTISALLDLNRILNKNRTRDSELNNK